MDSDFARDCCFPRRFVALANSSIWIRVQDPPAAFVSVFFLGVGWVARRNKNATTGGRLQALLLEKRLHLGCFPLGHFSKPSHCSGTVVGSIFLRSAFENDIPSEFHSAWLAQQKLAA
jgi:hypothetical protein